MTMTTNCAGRAGSTSCFAKCMSRSRIRSTVCEVFFFQAEDGIRDYKVTGVQTCALPISGTADDVKTWSVGVLVCWSDGKCRLGGIERRGPAPRQNSKTPSLQHSGQFL